MNDADGRLGSCERSDTHNQWVGRIAASVSRQG